MRRHRLMPLLAVGLLVLAAPGPAAGAAVVLRPPVHSPSGAGAAPTRLIVRYRDGVPASTRSRVTSVAGGRLQRMLRSIGADVITSDTNDVDGLRARLARDPHVLWVSPDAPLHADGDPMQEPEASRQWALENTGGQYPIGGSATITGTAGVDIDASSAYPIATGAGVTVAVLDDGVDFTYPDLVGQAWTNPGETGGGKETNNIDDDGDGYVDDAAGVNICNDAPDSVTHRDGVDFHGTAVAGVIAAATNGSGLAGVAPDAKIMAVRFLDGSCATTSFAVDAIAYAVDHGAKIINASWGGPVADPALQAAISAANAAGVLFVAASGNEGSATPHYPAGFSLPNIVSVAAIGPTGAFASYSNYGPSWVDMAAPGDYVLGADVESPGQDLLAAWQGTSFAAPHVAAVAALIAQARPDLLGNPIALRSKLMSSGWISAPSAGRTESGRSLDARYALDFTPPVLPAGATGAAVAGTKISSTAGSARVTWPPASDDLGIDSYRVRYRVAGTSSWSTLLAATSTPRADRSLTFGTAYEFEIRARDRGANSATVVLPFRILRYEQNTSLATWSSGWSTASSSSASSGSTKYATRAGSSVTFTFSGRSVGLVGPRSSSRGTAYLSIDGVSAGTISEHGTSASKLVLFSRQWTTSGTHVVRITVKSGRFDVDAFVGTR